MDEVVFKTLFYQDFLDLPLFSAFQIMSHQCNKRYLMLCDAQTNQRKMKSMNVITVNQKLTEAQFIRADGTPATGGHLETVVTTLRYWTLDLKKGMIKCLE